MLNTQQGELTATPPFDFAPALRFLGAFPPARGEQSIACEQTLTKAVGVNGEGVLFEVRSTGTLECPRLAYTLWAANPITPKLQRTVEDRLSFFLSLMDDLRPFYAIAQTDLLFAPVLAHWYGYHQVKFLTPFETACWAVLTQRTPLAIAHQRKRKLVERYGPTLTVNNETYTVFPAAETLAQVAPEELTATLGHERQATYLSAVAQAFATVDESFLRTGPYSDVETWLRRIKGIGEWSAAFVLLRGLGRMERVPLGEARLKAVVGHRYGPRPITVIAERYGTYQGYWAHYLRAAG